MPCVNMAVEDKTISGFEYFKWEGVVCVWWNVGGVSVKLTLEKVLIQKVLELLSIYLLVLHQWKTTAYQFYLQFQYEH